MMLANQKTVTVSAASCSKGEKILEAIAKERETFKYLRKFGDWQVGESGLKECHGEISEIGKTPVQVILTVGRVGDIPIEDVSGSRWHPLGTDRGFTVQVGKALPDRRIDNIANQLVSWIARGSDSFGKVSARRPGLAMWADSQWHGRRRGLSFVHQ